MKFLKRPVWDSSCQYRKSVTLCTSSSWSSLSRDYCFW